MLWTICVILVVLWLLGLAGGIGGSLIHTLLVIAAIVLVYNLITGRRRVLYLNGTKHSIITHCGIRTSGLISSFSGADRWEKVFLPASKPLRPHICGDTVRKPKA